MSGRNNTLQLTMQSNNKCHVHVYFKGLNFLRQFNSQSAIKIVNFMVFFFLFFLLCFKLSRHFQVVVYYFISWLHIIFIIIYNQSCQHHRWNISIAIKLYFINGDEQITIKQDESKWARTVLKIYIYNRYTTNKTNNLSVYTLMGFFKH